MRSYEIIKSIRRLACYVGWRNVMELRTSLSFGVDVQFPEGTPLVVLSEWSREERIVCCPNGKIALVSRYLCEGDGRLP